MHTKPLGESKFTAVQHDDKTIAVRKRAIDFRWYSRADIKWPVAIKKFNYVHDGETTNISPLGAFISCPDPLHLNEIFELIIKPPGQEQPLTITARVVWLTRGVSGQQHVPCGMGVRFERISDAELEFISDLVFTRYQSHG